MTVSIYVSYTSGRIRLSLFRSRCKKPPELCYSHRAYSRTHHINQQNKPKHQTAKRYGAETPSSGNHLKQKNTCSTRCIIFPYFIRPFLANSRSMYSVYCTNIMHSINHTQMLKNYLRRVYLQTYTLR